MKSNDRAVRAKRQKKEARLHIVAEYYKRGYSMAKIRTEVMARLDLATYSISTVHKDIKSLVKEWRDSRLEDVDDYIQLELARIDDILVELWQQWEKSKQDYARKMTRRKGAPSKRGSGEGIDTLLLEESTTNILGLGDVSYLAEIRHNLIERRKLLGLYAPEKREVQGTVVHRSPMEMSVEEIEAEMRALQLDA